MPKYNPNEHKLLPRQCATADLHVRLLAHLAACLHVHCAGKLLVVAGFGENQMRARLAVSSALLPARMAAAHTN